MKYHVMISIVCVQRYGNLTLLCYAYPFLRNQWYLLIYFLRINGRGDNRLGYHIYVIYALQYLNLLLTHLTMLQYDVCGDSVFHAILHIRNPSNLMFQSITNNHYFVVLSPKIFLAYYYYRS